MAESSSAAGLPPHTLIVLLDCQKAFLTGEWAQCFGLEQVVPIAKAFDKTRELLEDKRRLAGCSLLCTKCYTDGEEADYREDLQPLLADVPCVWKPTMDITRNPAFHRTCRAHLDAGIQKIIVGGCTTTSCVRVSSQAIRRAYPDPALRVVVDLSLCGAREDNYAPCADQDPVLVSTYGLERCRGASPVDLAIVQMRESGVEVHERYDFLAETV